MIQEELTKLADEAEDEEDGEGDADAEKDVKQAAQEVETWVAKSWPWDLSNNIYERPQNQWVCCKGGCNLFVGVNHVYF